MVSGDRWGGRSATELLLRKAKGMRTKQSSSVPLETFWRKRTLRFILAVAEETTLGSYRDIKIQLDMTRVTQPASGAFVLLELGRSLNIALGSLPRIGSKLLHNCSSHGDRHKHSRSPETKAILREQCLACMVISSEPYRRRSYSICLNSQQDQERSPTPT